ncbi:hypothetical protein MMC06_006074 [Schaereria dolodes]|nr:hypothetical protein [Schaereria dolodes]
MANLSSSADALLTEHLRYTPLSLIDDIINTVNAIIYQAIQAIESGLLSTPPQALGFGAESSSTNLSIRDTDDNGNVQYPEAAMEIENGVHQLETLLEAATDKNFDIFEIYALRNILTVHDLAPWMRLGHYEDLFLPLHPSSPTPTSILELRQRVQETQKLNLSLQNEYARNATLLSRVKALITPPTNSPTTGPKTEQDSPNHHHHSHPTSSSSQPSEPVSNVNFTFLTTPPAAQSLGLTLQPPIPQPHSNPNSISSPNTPLTTLATFTTSQLPSLRALLSSLRPALRTLSTKPATYTPREQERRNYLEERVRRAVAGREMMDVGEEQSEGVVGGERRTAEEVAALEAIVGSSGGGGEGAREGDVEMRG